MLYNFISCEQNYSLKTLAFNTSIHTYIHTYDRREKMTSTCSELSRLCTSLSTRSRNRALANFSSVISMDFLQNLGWNFGAVASDIWNSHHKVQYIHITMMWNHQNIGGNNIAPRGRFLLSSLKFAAADSKKSQTFSAFLSTPLPSALCSSADQNLPNIPWRKIIVHIFPSIRTYIHTYVVYCQPVCFAELLDGVW